MNFEHLVQINDEDSPLSYFLNREQLWKGLVIRAEAPDLVMPGLESCKITERGESHIRRELDFGRFTIRDHVTFVEGVSVSYVTEVSEISPVAFLDMVIEEPQPGELFVRFTYRQEDTAEALESGIEQLRKEAYRRADLDTIAMIRRFASQGYFAAKQ